MSYYFIANISIRDEQEYQRYIDQVDEVFQKSKGTYLVVDNDPVVLEGSWDYTRSVVIRFETREDFDGWYSSDDYQQILKHRLAGAVCDTILVKGLEK